MSIKLSLLSLMRSKARLNQRLELTPRLLPKSESEMLSKNVAVRRLVADIRLYDINIKK